MLRERAEKLVRSLYIRGVITSGLHMKVVEDAIVAEFREETHPGIIGSNAGEALRKVILHLEEATKAFKNIQIAVEQFPSPEPLELKFRNLNSLAYPPVEVTKPTKFYVNPQPWKREKKR